MSETQKHKISHLECRLDTTEKLWAGERKKKTKMHVAIVSQMSRGDWYDLKESEPELYNYVKETIEIAENNRTKI